jgi:hypothetical protein
MTNTLYIKKRTLAMKQIHLSLLLAAAMIGIAILSVFDFVPEEVAQFSPFLLLALFPAAWLRDRKSCNLLKQGKA